MLVPADNPTFGVLISTTPTTMAPPTVSRRHIRKVGAQPARTAIARQSQLSRLCTLRWRPGVLSSGRAARIISADVATRRAGFPTCSMTTLTRWGGPLSGVFALSGCMVTTVLSLF